MKECKLTPEQIQEICDRYPNELSQSIASSMGVTQSQIYRIRKIYDLRKSPECRKIINEVRHKGGFGKRGKKYLDEHLDIVIREENMNAIEGRIEEINQKLLTTLSVREFEELTSLRNSLTLKLQQ